MQKSILKLLNGSGCPNWSLHLKEKVATVKYLKCLFPCMEYVGLVFALFVPSQNNMLSPTAEQASRVKAHCLLPLRNEVQEWNSEQKRLET